MAELRPYRSGDTPLLAAVWNACFQHGPAFVRLGEADLRRRVMDQPAFDSSSLLLATVGDRVLGFSHWGPRLEWEGGAHWAPGDSDEGHVYALVAPSHELSLTEELLAMAEEKLRERGARRVLLGPSWVCGVQPFYNGIAGAYEMPGLSAARESVLLAAEGRGYRTCAEYGTPELDLSGPAPLDHLSAALRRLREQARELGLTVRSRPIEMRFFPKRLLVELAKGRKVVATTAYGLWPEYEREHHLRMYGLTSVQVAPDWRGKGLGKLVMIEAMEAARREGAEAVHLHVWRGNEPAWNLYHRALGFAPGRRWVTLEKQVG